MNYPSTEQCSATVAHGSPLMPPVALAAASSCCTWSSWSAIAATFSLRSNTSACSIAVRFAFSRGIHYRIDLLLTQAAGLGKRLVLIRKVQGCIGATAMGCPARVCIPPCCELMRCPTLRLAFSLSSPSVNCWRRRRERAALSRFFSMRFSCLASLSSTASDQMAESCVWGRNMIQCCPPKIQLRNMMDPPHARSQ